jgi:hypothetical protein
MVFVCFKGYWFRIFLWFCYWILELFRQCGMFCFVFPVIVQSVWKMSKYDCRSQQYLKYIFYQLFFFVFFFIVNRITQLNITCLFVVFSYDTYSTYIFYINYTSTSFSCSIHYILPSLFQVCFNALHPCAKLLFWTVFSVIFIFASIPLDLK